MKPKPDTGRPSSRYSSPSPSSGGAAFSPSKPERDSKSNYSVPVDGGAQPSSPVADWVFCGHCGEKIGAEDVYCAHCGNRQPAPGSGASMGLSASPMGAARITAQLYVVGTNDM